MLPGLTAMASPGHTVGHTSLVLEDRDETLLIGGDAAGHHVLQLELPDSHMAPDHSGREAITSRNHILAWAAERDALVHAFHWPWPWPGLGHVAGEGTGWRFATIDAGRVPSSP